MDVLKIGELLGLLVVANGAPILARSALGERGAWPIDCGVSFLDGRPLLGASKTFRGIGAAVAAAALVGPLLHLSAGQAGAFALCSMAGDLFSSFLKRRLGSKSGASLPGVDQAFEAGLPLLAFRSPLALTVPEMAAIAGLFFVVGIAFSQLLFRLRIRRRH